MIRREALDDFLAQKVLALAGASRSGRKFGNTLFRELTARGYVVHPEATEIIGTPCVPSLAALPIPVGGLILTVSPGKAEGLVREAAEAGIRRIWMQQGSASPKAIRRCEEKGITLVRGECLLMFTSPTGVHAFHRWLRGVLGKLPVLIFNETQPTKREPRKSRNARKTMRRAAWGEGPQPRAAGFGSGEPPGPRKPDGTPPAKRRPPQPFSFARPKGISRFSRFNLFSGSEDFFTTTRQTVGCGSSTPRR